MRGIYTSTSLMLSALDYQALVTKNMANANTTGYKADRLRLTDFEHMLLDLNGNDTDPLGLGVATENAPIDLSQGPIKQTERDLDLALTGRAFFLVQTPQGVRLTRDGGFGLDANRQLVTSEGYPVLGQNGPVTLPAGEISITEDGRISVNGNAVAQLSLAVITDEGNVRRVGENLFDAPYSAANPGDAQVHQGYLEGSNVDIATETSKMMAVFRTYEAAQRVILMQAQTVDSAAADVGRV